MNHDKFNDTIATLLESGRVGHVISTLRSKFNDGMQSHPDLGRFSSELDTVAENYAHMRRFLVEGKPDPERFFTYDWIKSELRNLGRNYLFIFSENRPDPMFAEYRFHKSNTPPLEHLFTQFKRMQFRMEKAIETESDPGLFIRKKEETVDLIFRKIWSLPPWATEDLETIGNKLAEDVPFELKSQMVSALLLALLKFNDPAKFLILLKAYDSIADERLEARILTSIVLVLARWGNSALSTPEIVGSLQSLQDSILTYTRLRDVVMTLIRTRDTDRVTREVNEAFNSTMKEITPEMLEKLQRDGMAVDSSETGMNPEWEKLMKNKEIEEKMQAINDMQLEGMDVMMQTFARLKHFSFFRSISNWFLPFTIDHSEVAPLFPKFSEEGFSAMADATEMCSGDRFSFVLGILQMPEDKRNLLAASVGASLEMIKDQIKDRENVRRKSVFASEALSFARDLYRFAKIFPRRNNFYDPFEEVFDFTSLPAIGAVLNENEILLTAADFYFNHGYYSLALPLYEKASSSGEAERHIYEKIGYCCQMLSDYHSALESYEKADLFSSDADESSTWLLKRLAFCNKALGRYDKAADYYRKLIERNPDDLNVEFHLASVLLRSGEVKEAKDLVSKVHYLNPDHEMCSRIYNRLKAHDAFVNGNYSEALSLYESARGSQNKADYRRDLLTELKSLYPSVDEWIFSILTDNEAD